MTNLELTAIETLDEAVAGLRAGYLEWLAKTYQKAAEAAAKDLGREPRVWSDEDKSRILFEASAYMSALLLEHELGGYLTRRKLLFGREPDRDRIEAFRAPFLRYFPEKMRSLGLAKVEIPTVLIRLASIERRSLEFPLARIDPRRDDTVRDVRRVLPMVPQR